MHLIEIANSQDLMDVDEEFLIQAAELVLSEEQVAGAEISVALVDDPTIHALNRQYLNHDYDTDVLSFLLECEEPPAEESPAEPRETLRGRGKRIDGEVIISTETALGQAEKFGWSPREELVLYLVHGLLHLVGYDDLSPTEQAVMRTRERAMLTRLQITPPDHSPAEESESDEESERPKPTSASPPRKRRTES